MPKYPYSQIGVDFDEGFRTTLNNALTNVEDDFKEVQGQINKLVIDGDSGPQAALAAVDANGVDKGTLKERLDDDYNEITSSLADLAKRIQFVSYDLFDVNRDKKYYNPANGNYYLDEAFTEIYTVDDGIKIKQCHDFANQYGLPVKNYVGDYVIRDTRNIDVLTSCDLSGSTFHVDETISGDVFIVKSDKPSFILDATLYPTLLPKLKKGSKQLEELASYHNHYMIIIDDTTKIAIRDGLDADTGQPMQDVTYIGKNGKLIGDICWDFQNITQILMYPCNTNYLTMKLGTFLLSGNLYSSVYGDYKKNGVRVQRSRTIVDVGYVGLEKGVTDNPTASSSGFITLSDVYDIKLKNLKNTPRKPLTVNGNIQGSYGFSFNRVLQLVIEDVEADSLSSDWGVMYSSFVKNLYVRRSHLGRIDAHIHAWNVYIDQCKLGKTIQFVGGGDLHINDTVVKDRIYLGMRMDYGSKWDGNIRVTNPTLKIPKDIDVESIIYLINFNTTNHDFGYDVIFGQDISFEDITIDFSEIPTSLNNVFLWYFPTISTTGTRKIIYPIKMRYERLTVIGREKGVRFGKIDYPHKVKVYGDKDFIYDTAREEIKGNAEIVLKHIQTEKLLVNTQTSTDDHLRISVVNTDVYDAKSYVPKITIENCDYLVLKPLSAIFELKLTDCDIQILIAQSSGNARSVIKHFSCRYNPNTINDSSNLIKTVGAYVSYVNTIFYQIKYEGVTSATAAKIRYGTFDLTAGANLINDTHIGTTLSGEVITAFAVTSNMIKALNSHNRKESASIA